MADWTYLLADLRTQKVFAEIPLNGANPTKKLNASGSCSGSFPVARIVRGDPYRFTTPARTCLYVLRDGEPYWGGIIWSRRYSASSGTVDIQASDWWSYFDHRFIVTGNKNQVSTGSVDDGKTANGYSEYLQVGQNTITRALIAQAQAFVGGNIDVTVVGDPNYAGPLRLIRYMNAELNTVSSALADLAKLVDGPDIMFDTAGFNTLGQPRRLLRLGSPELGRPGPPPTFEYGGNMLDYTWSSDGTQMSTRTWATGSGSTTSTMMARSDNTVRIGQGWPLLEATTSYTSVTSQPVLTAQAASDAVIDRLPLVTPSFTVRTDRPPYLDFAPGDLARLVIADDYFRDGIDTMVRIIDVSPSTTTDTCQVQVNPIYEDVM